MSDLEGWLTITLARWSEPQMGSRSNKASNFLRRLSCDAGTTVHMYNIDYLAMRLALRRQ